MFKDIFLRLLQERGTKASQINEATGISNGLLSDYKTGAKKPSSENLSKIADYFGVTTDYLLGRPQPPTNMVSFPMTERRPVRVIGSVTAGYNCVAIEEELGFEYAEVENPDEYRFFRVTGDSMLPEIKDGDYALVRLQNDVDSGDIAVVVYDGEIGTVKKVIKKDNAIILQPLNPTYDTKIYTGDELCEVMIYGKVVEIKRKY